MRDNIKYMLSNWLKWDRKSLVYFLIRIPALVFQPIVTSYIPKAMIDCINEGATVGRLTLVVGLLSVLVVLTTWLSPFMQELLNGSARIIRMPIIQISKARAAEKRIREQWSFTAAIIRVRRISSIRAINFAYVL